MSLPRYAEYKESGVPWLGEVPAHWSIAPLGTLSTSIQTGPFGSQLHSEDYVDDETPVINPSNIQNGRLIADASCTVPAHIVERLSEHKLFTGDIVFARRGEMGRCAMVAASEAGWICGTGSLNVRLGDKALPEFVSDFLGTPHVKELLKLESVGSTMDNLNTAILSHVQVPTPPLEEQFAIAAFLDRETCKIDALIAEQEKLLTLLAEKRQATISHAVTRGLNPNAPMKDSGVPWLGEVPTHWTMDRLGALFRETAELGNDDLPILSVSIHDGVSDKELDDAELDRKVTRSDDRSKYKRVLPNDLTYNMMRAWQGGFGSVAVAGQVSPAYVVATPRRELRTVFVEQLLRTPRAIEQVRRYSRGITEFRLRLYWDEFKNIRIALPPLAEQDEILSAIASMTDKYDALSGEARHAIDLLKERRSALIAAAVTGKIDVRQVA
jgi:type I restriction enzyme, S subunit